MVDLSNALSIPRARRLFVEKKFRANCLLSDAVQDCVVITADRVGSLYQVTKSNPTTVANGPAQGIIIQKLSSTTCIVQMFGLVEGVYTGLALQLPQYVGLNGRLTTNSASILAPPAGKVFVQHMGVAIASDVFLLNPQAPMVRLP